MSINLTDGMSTSGGSSMSPQIFSGSMEFTLGQINQLSPASTQFDLIGDFTIEAWVYPTAQVNWGIFDARVNGGSAAPWVVALRPAGAGFVILWFDGSPYYGTGVVPLNVWSHVAVVRVGSTLTFYLNGEVDTVISYTSAALSPGSTSPTVGTKDYGLGGYGTVGNISNLRIVVGVAVYTSAFTPSTSPLTVIQPANFNGNPSSVVPYDNTVLLLNSDDNGFNFLDRSKNNFTLIGPDMPLPSNLSPFIGSLLFNGTSDYLIVNNTPNAAFDFGTGDFTVESWVYLTSYTGYNQIICGNIYGASADWLLAIPFNGTVIFYGTNALTQVDATSVIPLNTWTHLAFSMVSGTGTIYYNGVNVGSGSIGNLGNGTPITIGGDYTANPSTFFNGYLNNLRVVKGVGVYTTNFSVPPNVLTSVQGANINGFPSSAISSTQTSLLLSTPNNNNSYLVDSSIYQNIVLGPLMPTPSSVVPITDGNFDGSILFNGTSDYLTVDNSGASPEFTFGAGDWTIECWIYPTTGGLDQGIISKLYNIGTEAGPFTIQLNSSNIPVLYSCSNGGGVGWDITALGTTPVSLNTWSHIAFTRNGNVFTTWVNGVLSATVTISFTLYDNSLESVVIGSADSLGNPSFLFHGNISNMRVTKGVAVYTSNFTPSRQSLTSTQSLNINGIPSAAISGTETSLLLNTPNDVNYLVDSSSYNFTITPVGSPTASSSIPTVAVANGSSLFNGTTQYLTVPSSNDLTFGTGDFTVEGWYNFNSFGIDNALILLGTGAIIGINYAAWWVRYYTGSGGPFLQLYRYAGGSEENYTFSLGSALSTNQWYHIACARYGTDLRMFLNGTQVDVTQTCATNYTIVNSDPLIIGRVLTGNGTFYLDGKASNIRVVKGLAVYTTDFTPSTTPLTATQLADVNGNPSAAITGTETSLLLNTFNSGLNRVDSSSYNLLVTSPNTPAPDNSAPSFVSEGSFLSNGYQYLQIPYSSYGNLFDQDGAFTIECWFYQTSIAYAGTFVWCQDVNSGDSWRCIYSNGYFGCSNHVGVSITSAPIFGNLNTWYHIALSSDGTTTRLFVNGTFQGSYAGTGIALTQDIPFQIAWGNYNGPYSYGIYGNISNFRFVKGVAVYTTAFTPPSSDLTATQNANTNGYPSAAITGYQTSLLLNTTNDVLNHLDSSTHQLLVTTPSTPIPAAWNPYNLGSISFNGTSDYLIVPSNTALAFGTGDFTVECWVNWTGLTTSAIFDNQTAGGFNLYYDAGTYLLNYLVVSNRYVDQLTYPWTPSLNTWYHISISRSGTNLIMFINGVLVTSTDSDTTDYQAGDYNIGNDSGVGGWYLNGYLSNFRAVKGLAVYTTDFTPPTQPLNVSQNAGTNINPVTPYQTSLLLNTIDSPNNLLDSSIYNLTLSIAGTPTAVINNPFGPL